MICYDSDSTKIKKNKNEVHYPMEGIIVAAGNLISKNGKILLVQETFEEIKGKWNLPVGRLEEDEGIIACGKREGEEETGLTLKPSYLIGVYQVLALKCNVIIFVFKSEINGGKLTIPEDIMDVQWFSPDEIRDMENKGLLADSYILRVLECYQNGNNIPLRSITFSRGT